ncbi:FAD binding domain-containing protein [Dactylosporangium siamense]|uniref:Carbon monoxide dehydrogenase medium subunit n=1 Tax=Dactylosporangium siamense TaxID=685454 RepID=A0A919UD78_9ACTN|nr:xanthine dehydrogenase family protein subunit M [Dactylosporangium siamense]GIG47395.1 carbon monoxide dehydrogenase medium subunit [Dactylosporangium siamense]
MQVPAAFEYAKATSVTQTLDLLAQWGEDARVIAGGHSLIPMMKLRLARPTALIDINDVDELSYIKVEGGELRIGALTRHAELLESALVEEHYRIFRDAERVIADPIVRNRGTVGGSLCQADPAEDLSAAFAAVGASVVIQGARGSRTVPLTEFHVGPYETVVEAGELLTEVRVPIRPGGGSAYVKVERRVGDWAVAAAGAALWTSSEGTVSNVGIGLAAVGAEHFRAAEAEVYLVGKPATEESFAEAGRIAAQHSNPVADQRGPVDYKRHLAGELTVRALRAAAARARGQEA